MHRHISATIGAVVLCCLITGSATAAVADTSPEEIVRSYVGALVDADWEWAESLWVAGDVERSHRLGIIYKGAPVKIDCASPVLGALDGIRGGAVTYSAAAGSVDGAHARVGVGLIAGGDSVHVWYDLLQTAEGWRLASAPTVHARGWQVQETRYARVYFSDSTLVNLWALEELDRFIDSAGRVLGLSDERVRILAEEKLDCYLGDADAIEAMSGYRVHGMTHLGLDAVVSQHLPHYHEIVHAVMNFAFADPELHALPCLQEGAAVHLGGRWGKSAPVMAQLGVFMLDQEFASLDDILTWRGFHRGTGNLDISYALSGLLVGYLVDHLGWTEFLALYRAMSGSDRVVRSFMTGQVRSQIAARLGKKWERIVSEFDGYVARHQGSGLLPGCSDTRVAALFEIDRDSLTVRIWDVGTVYGFEVASDAGIPRGVVALSVPADAQNGSEGYRSRLFERQLAGMTHAGQRYGIVFTPEEAGLYDYATDNLLAKYVQSFAPSESYWDAGTRVIRFRISKRVLPGSLEDFELELLHVD